MLSTSINNASLHRWNWLASQLPEFTKAVTAGKVGFIAMENDPASDLQYLGGSYKEMRLKNTLGLAIHFTPATTPVYMPYMSAGSVEERVDDVYVALTENQLIVGGKAIHRLQPSRPMDLTDFLDCQPVWKNLDSVSEVAGGLKRGRQYFIVCDHDGDSSLKKSQAHRFGYLPVAEPKKTEPWATQAVLDYNRKTPYRVVGSNGVTYVMTDMHGDRGVAVKIKP